MNEQNQVPYMTLALNYGAPRGVDAGMLLTVITPDKQYLPFGTPNGNGGCQPMVTSDRPALWTTITPISAGQITGAVAASSNVAESGSLDVIASNTPPTGYACTLMVSLFKARELDPSAPTWMQSQALPVTLYANADNVVSVFVYNTDDDWLPPFSSGAPDKNGQILVTVRNQAGVGAQGVSPQTSGSEFWWSKRVPSLAPAWLTDLINVAFNTVLSKGLAAIAGGIAPIVLSYVEKETGISFQFTNGAKRSGG